jgi:hypothetical protein
MRSPERPSDRPDGLRHVCSVSSDDDHRRHALCEALRLTKEAERLVTEGAPGAKAVLIQAQDAIAKSNSSYPPAEGRKPSLRQLAVQHFRNLLKQHG